jgi:hypothetical protein
LINIFNYTVLFQLLADFLPIAFLYSTKIPINKHLKILLFSSFIINFILISTNFLKINNSVFFVLYLLIGYVLYSLYFVSFFKNYISKIILGTIPLFFIFFLFEYIYLKKFNISLNFFILSQAVWSILYFSNSIFINPNQSSSKFYDFVNSSILFYASTTFIFFVFLMNFMENHLWFYHNLIEGVSKILITFAIWKIPIK